MSIAKPTVANPLVLPESLQLLSVVLLLALSLCIPIIVLTNHVKRAATILASVPYSQSSAAETIPQPDIRGPRALEAAAPIAQPQRGGVAITPQETGMSNRILPKLFSPTRAVRGRRMSPRLSGTWFRTNSPRHVTTALITISHQHSKRRQKPDNVGVPPSTFGALTSHFSRLTSRRHPSHLHSLSTIESTTWAPHKRKRRLQPLPSVVRHVCKGWSLRLRLRGKDLATRDRG